MSELMRKTISSVAFLSLGKGAGKLISFVNTLILARILAPEDYGLLAMAMVFVGVMGFFSDLGLGMAIIQRKDVTKEQTSAVFFLAIINSTILASLLFILSGNIANWMGSVSLAPILATMAWLIVINAFFVVPESLLAKNMEFKLISFVEFITIVIQCVITLVLALYEYQVWALVIGTIVASLLKLVLFFALSKWLPCGLVGIRPAFTLIKYGLAITYSRVTWYLYSNISILILGKMTGEKQTGIFSMSQSLANLPTEHCTNLVVQVASPVFSKVQDDLSALTSALSRLTAGLAFLTFPMLAGVIVTAPELVLVLLGDKWGDVVLPLQFLCVMGFCKAIDPLLTQALISSGRAKITAHYTSLCAVVIPVAISIGSYYYQINGAAFALSTTYLLLFSYLLLSVKRHLSLSIRHYLSLLITPITGAVVMAILLTVLKLTLLSFWQTSDVISLITQVLSGALCYFLWVVFFRKNELEYLKEILANMGLANKLLNKWPFAQRKST
ncbi:lipopolysaccharide biosynthesis protein [Colwelliaceae bacterium 6441]